MWYFEEKWPIQPPRAFFDSVDVGVLPIPPPPYLSLVVGYGGVCVGVGLLPYLKKSFFLPTCIFPQKVYYRDVLESEALRKELSIELKIMRYV